MTSTVAVSISTLKSKIEVAYRSTPSSPYLPLMYLLIACSLILVGLTNLVKYKEEIINNIVKFLQKINFLAALPIFNYTVTKTKLFKHLKTH